MNLEHLHAPFPPNEIEWRVGSTNSDKTSGLALAYLTARHVMERLDEVCGAENWQDRYEFHGSRTICYLSLRIDGEWVTKADGAGDSDVEAEKGAISDALKRAAVKWGVGRYLYQLGNTWVKIKGAGKSFKIDDSEYPKLERSLAAKFGTPPSDMQRTAEPPPQNMPEPGGFQSHIDAINASGTLDDLQKAFLAAKADKTLTADEAVKVIARKDAVKAAFGRAIVPPNFDNIESDIPYPPATQEALNNLSAG